ncbi:MAG TPA: hypothetical protein VIN38_12415 [Thiobacillus sp.]
MHPTDKHDNAIDELGSDADFAKSLLAREDSQFNRRIYIRAIFAYLEGYAFFMRRNAEEILEKRRFLGKDIDPALMFLLREKVPQIVDGGAVKYRKHKVPFADHLAFTMRTIFDALEINRNLFEESEWKPGWIAFKDTLNIRDRVTHPKLQSDIGITDGDLEICESGLFWFRSLIQVLSNKNDWGLGKK